MTYLVLILLAVAAGLLLGSVPALDWPWRRRHPVRSTLAAALPVLGIAVVMSAHLLGWDDGRLANLGIWTGACLMTLVSVWLAPNRPAWAPGPPGAAGGRGGGRRPRRSLRHPAEDAIRAGHDPHLAPRLERPERALHQRDPAAGHPGQVGEDAGPLGQLGEQRAVDMVQRDGATS